MGITKILSEMGGLQSMANELGITESQAASGASALAPAILGGMRKAQGQAAGSGGLGGLLSQLGGGGLLDNVLSREPTDVSRGNEVLGQIFGSKDVSRAVAQDASSRTGLDPALLKKMLPMLAMMVAGAMAKQDDGGDAAPSGGGLGGMLGGLLGGAGRSGGSGGALAGLAAMLDEDGDGNPLDDILSKLGKSGR